jgi:cytochrome c
LNRIAKSAGALYEPSARTRKINKLKLMNYFSIAVAFKTAAALSAFLAAAANAAGDPVRGARDFRPCMACHSVKSGEHSIGPSLADLWNRKAGTVEGFSRYTSELREANVEWNESSLDKWLSAPQQFVPGTSMRFQGIMDEKERSDIIAYLKAVSENIAPGVSPQGVISGKRSRGG